MYCVAELTVAVCAAPLQNKQNYSDMLSSFPSPSDSCSGHVEEFFCSSWSFGFSWREREKKKEKKERQNAGLDWRGGNAGSASALWLAAGDHLVSYKWSGWKVDVWTHPKATQCMCGMCVCAIEWQIYAIFVKAFVFLIMHIDFP